MTIDISQLDSEKRAFLKVNPALLESLETQIPKQVAGIQKRRKKLEKGKAKWQQDMDHRIGEVEALRREYDPELMKINRKFLPQPDNGLVCPECGDNNHGNKMNGKSWCLECNEPLIPKNKIDAWEKMPKIRVIPKDLRNEIKRLLSQGE